MEKQLEVLQAQRRYDKQYGKIEEIEIQIDDVQSQIRSIRREKISGDNIYQLLLTFDEVYGSASEAEQKEFMQAFIERIELFPEKQKDGNWIRNIVFNFPVPVNGGEVKEPPLEYETTVETECLLSNRKCAGNETKSELATDLGECRDTARNLKNFGRKPDSYVKWSLDMEDCYRIKDAEKEKSRPS